MAIDAKITITPNRDVLALYRMLAENGTWLVRVHNRHIVRATLVPPESPVEALLGEHPREDLRDSGK
jgi:hypothetical protein